jgi:hypothetical protein
LGELRSDLEEKLGGVERALLGERVHEGAFLNLPKVIFPVIQAYFDKGLLLREVNKVCSGGITESLAQLTLGGSGGGMMGGAASLTARCPRVKKLCLKDRLALEEYVHLYIRGGWWSGAMTSLDIGDWAVMADEPSTPQLKAIRDELMHRSFSHVEELKVALTDRVYRDATAASALMMPIIGGMPNLTHLQLTAPGRVGLTKADVGQLVTALTGGKLRRLVLDVDCRRGNDNMPLAALLSYHPALESLTLSAKFGLWVALASSEMQLNDQRPQGKANVGEMMGMVTAALPNLPRLRSLALSGDVFFKDVSMDGLLSALLAASRVRLTHLALRCFVWDANVFGQLVRSGRLDALEQLSLTSCGLQWRHVTGLLREAILPDGTSSLRRLQHLDVRFNPLFTAEEQAQADTGFSVAQPPTLPPQLKRIAVATMPPMSDAVIALIKVIFPTGMIDA